MIQQQAETPSKQFCSEVQPELGGEQFTLTEQCPNDIEQLAPDHCGEVAFTHRCQDIAAGPGLRESGLINKSQDELTVVGLSFERRKFSVRTAKRGNISFFYNVC